MNQQNSEIEQCSGCGLKIPGGSEACHQIFEQLLARDYSDPAFFRYHRMLVDTYALQHPDQHCVSAKSLAAHLTGLCLLLEEPARADVGTAALKRWLDGLTNIVKPTIPSVRGTRTISCIADINDQNAYGDALCAWAKTTWDSFADLHTLARQWMNQAMTNYQSHGKAKS